MLQIACVNVAVHPAVMFGKTFMAHKSSVAQTFLYVRIA